MRDEVDVFNDNRLKIALNEDESDGEQDSDDNQQYLDLQDGEEDDEESSDEDEYQMVAVPGGSDDDFDAEEMTRRAENRAKAWGKKKKQFRGADTEDFEAMDSDDGVAEEEEQEGLTMQRARAQELDEDLDDEDEDDTLEALVASTSSVTKSKKKTKKAANDKTNLNDLNNELSSLDLPLGENISVEKVAKDTSSLDKDGKLQILLNDAPELLGLTEELKSVLAELNNQVKPMLEKAKKSSTKQGLSFLEVKYQLLLSYSTNLTFFLLLKAEGKNIKNHPVLRQLIHYRAMLEALRPIDKKLRYQLEKLLKQDAIATAKGNDLSLKPKPQNLKTRQDVDDEENDLGMNDYEAQDDSNKLYRPPKINAVNFEEETETQKKRDARIKKNRKKAKESEYMRELQKEILFPDRPDEIDMGGVNGRGKDAAEKEVQEYEEKTFSRLFETKATLKKKRAKERINPYEDLDDFDDLSMLTKPAGKPLGEVSSMDKLAKMKAAFTKKRAFTEMDDDSLFDSYDGLSLYQEAAETAQKKKKQKKEVYAAPQNILAKEDYDVVANEGKRKASTTILKNRGLTRYRPKDQKNPRVKYKMKHARAQIKLNSQIQKFKGKNPAYSGEKTGLKKHLVKSTKL